MANLIKRVSLTVFLSFCWVLVACASPDLIGSIPPDQNVNVPKTLPENLKQVPEIYISKNEYFISFNSNTHLLNWAAWKLDASDIGHVGRSDAFAVDPELSTYFKEHFNQNLPSPTDYKGSCFDKGHQVPSADRDISLDVNKITFLMNNMIPQTAYLNRFIWEQLESYARYLVTTENKKLYIFAGPIFDEDFGHIGTNNDIPVPSKNFKVIVVMNPDQTLADITSETKIISVVMPNILKTGKKPMEDHAELCSESTSFNPPKAPPPPAGGSDMTQTDPTAQPSEWMKYQVPLDEVEKLSGFKILH